MSIKCGSCRGRHDTIQQVLTCSSANHGRPECKHGLDAGSCITCAPWNKRKGTITILSMVAHPPAWVQDMDPLASGTCSLCRDLIIQNEKITVRKGFKNWSHIDCFTDPGTVLEQEPQKSQRAADPPYNPEYNRLYQLTQAAEELLAEAWQQEKLTTWKCLRQVAEDMDWELSIDLIRETLTGQDLEMLGAWDPKDPEDVTDDPEEIGHVYELWTEYERYMLV